MQLWINLKGGDDKGGTTNLILAETPEFQRREEHIRLGMRNRSNFAKLKFSEIEGAFA